MTGIEISLLVIGVIFFISSFFIAEKLSPGELGKIAELSDDEIKKVTERELSKATGEIEDKIGEKLEEGLSLAVRAMEKESNEKIMAINEYSDTVLESMNKTHNEIMFLYSMLNDKHTELTELTGELQKLFSDIKNTEEEINSHMTEVGQKILEQPLTDEELLKESVIHGPEFDEEEPKKEKAQDSFHYNDTILRLHKQGMSEVEIAKKLGLGFGEVKLVIELFEGEGKK